MSLRDRLARALFGDVIASAEEEARAGIDEGELSPQLDYFAKALSEANGPKFASGHNGAEPSGVRPAPNGTKQALSEPGSISDEEGILPLIPFDVFNRMYEEISWLRAGVDAVRRSFTATGWILSPAREGADPAHRDELMRFFDNVNPNDTMIEILDDIARDLYVTGNGFVEIVPNKARTKPIQLWSLNPDEMRVRIDGHGRVLGYVQVARGTLGHLRGVPAGGDPERARFAANEVIHLKLATKGSRVYGLSPFHSLTLAATVDTFAQTYNKAFFKRGGKVRGMYNMKNATPEQVKRNQAKLEERAKRPELAHSDIVMEGNIDWKQVGPNQKDMEFRELRRFGRDEMLAVIGVPPSKVSIIESGNIGAGTGESQDRTFHNETIVPLQKRVAAKITRKVIRDGFGFDDWDFAFEKRAPDPKQEAEIQEKRANAVARLVDSGILTPEEARARVGDMGASVVKSNNPADRSRAWAFFSRPDLHTEAGAKEMLKALKGAAQTIVDAPKGLVDLENSALRSFQVAFRKIKAEILERLPLLRREGLSKYLAGKKPRLKRSLTPWRFGYFTKVDFSREILKQTEGLDEVLEPVREERFVEPIAKWTGAAALAGLALTRGRIANRRGLKKPSALFEAKLTREFTEGLMANAVDLDRHLRREISDGVRASLVEGVAAGETTDQLIARVDAALDTWEAIPTRASLDAAGNVLRASSVRRLGRNARAEVIVRTELSRAFNEAAVEGYAAAGEVRAQFILSSTADAECLAVANSGAGGPSAGPGGKEGNFYPIDEMSGIIPVHHNCFLPGTVVSGKVIAAMRAAYSGEAVDIVTERGTKLSVTPNHPVLTPQGFVAASELRKGDHLVRKGGWFKFSPSGANVENPPARVEDIFGALSISRSHRQSSRPGDFHGDSQKFNGEVEVVWSDGSLRGDVEAPASELRRELRFVWPDVREVSLAMKGNLAALGKGVFSPSGGAPGSSALPHDRVLATTLDRPPFQLLRLGAAAECHAQKPEAPGQDAAAVSGFLRELKQGLPGKILFDEVVEVRHRDFEGWVYDVQSPHGWILANLVVASNCRCTWAPAPR